MSEEVTSPLRPDAPIHDILDCHKHPDVAKMSLEELSDLVKRIRQYTQSNPTLSAKLSEDSNAVNPRKKAASKLAQAKRDALANL